MLTQILALSRAAKTDLLLTAIDLVDPEDPSSDEELYELVSAIFGEQSSREENAMSPPRRKRTRVTRTEKPPAAKLKKGDLKQILDMPLEVFNEITRYLTPPDLLALARSTKLFRAMFMSRSSAPIWQSAINNVVGLPPCPPNMPAPHYTSLIYSRICSVQLLKADIISISIDEMSTDEKRLLLVPTSRDILPERPDVHYYLRRDLQSFMELIDDPRYKTQDVWDELIMNRRKELEERYQHAARLEEFLEDMEEDRANEIQELKEERRLSIEERLYEDGWTSEDLDFPAETRSRWNQLVLRPQPLTDRIWSNLQPKLVSMLEANRDRNNRLAE
ncbi:hypothetical protein FRC12_016938 [Ceratobasidium sp. 428]|nr:hypothetical protein FRC12_016938 [Ceratobasidium sp. 428]